MNRFLYLSFFFGFTLLIPSISVAQSAPSLSTDTTGEALVFVGEPSEFSSDYSSFLRQNLRYPKKAVRKRIQGKVYLKFIVETDGTLSDLIIVKGVDPLLDEEALRVVRLTEGKWTIAKNNGKPVRAYKNLAIEFRLR